MLNLIPPIKQVFPYDLKRPQRAVNLKLIKLTPVIKMAFMIKVNDFKKEGFDVVKNHKKERFVALTIKFTYTQQ